MNNRFQYLSRGRIATRGQMNKTETAYSEQLTADQNVAWWKFEPLTLRLSHPESGQPAKYTPDFLVVLRDGTTFLDDVKGSGLDDAASIVRIKAAAELFPVWRFRLAKARRVRDGGGFEIREV